MAKGVINVPYELRVGKDGYYVVNTDTNKRKNKHGMSKSKAKKYMAALYANKNPKQYDTKPKRKKSISGGWRGVLRKTLAKIL
tara:strand:+ start:28 stop:276 length:249 start_codon:yes stop_codon:yes gene_type:complete